MTETDIIIIGAGPGGYRAAHHAAKAGRRVVLIERGQLGGTCLHVGCIPTKTLARHAEVMETLRQAPLFGVSGVGEPAVNLQQVMERKEQVVAQLTAGIRQLLSLPQLRLVEGEARFVAPHVVAVGDEEFSAPAIIIATGSEPRMLTLEECDPSLVVSSDEMLSLSQLPRRLCIVGAGVIGMEFASIFSSFGSEVTVVEYLKECLPVLDSDIAKRLRKTLEKRGVRFVMQASVKAVRQGGVEYERKGKTERVEADCVLMAVGRKPRLEGLCLEAAGIDYTPKGIVVDDQLQTTQEGVYAIGDVNGRQMLAHAATMQGLHVVNRLLGQPDAIDLRVMPSAVFTLPEAASVGLSEDECKAQGLNYICRKAFHRANGKAMAMNETEGMVKLMADAATGLILGCHGYGAHTADMVQEVASLICRHTTLSQLADITHIHPTLGEMVQELAG